MKLSILIPVYNERFLVGELVRRVLAAPLPEDMERELVIVDDGSTDGTRAVLEQLAAEHPQRIVYLPQPRNQGKGAALRAAIAQATGEFCIVQDADLEYDPQEYPKLLAPLLSGRADVVYGSRFLPSQCRRVLSFWHTAANRALSLLSNMVNDLHLSDMETCYKAFRTEVLKTIPLRSNRFGFDPEVTAKVAKRRMRFYEVPICYEGRSYLEGKKIGFRDGLQTLWTILKYGLVDDAYDLAIAPEYLTDPVRAHRVCAWLADALRPHVGARVLEVGAGLGVLSGLLARERYVVGESREECLGVLRNLALRRRGLEVARLAPERAEDFAPFRGALDTVILVNVLERSDAPQAVLRNCFDALEPGGRLVLLAAQCPRLYGPLDRGLGLRRRSSREQTCEGLSAAGFGVERAMEFLRIGLSTWLLYGALLRRPRVPRIELKALDSTVWLWRRADWLLPWPGLHLVVVARKPAAGASAGVPGSP